MSPTGIYEIRHEGDNIMRGSLSQRTCHLQLTEAGTLQTLHGTEELPGVHASHMEFASYSHRDAVSNSAYTTQQAFRRRSFSFLPEHECLYTMSTHHQRGLLAVSSLAMPLWTGRRACHASMGSASSTTEQCRQYVSPASGSTMQSSQRCASA